MNIPTTHQLSLPIRKRRTAWLTLIFALAILCLVAMPPALSDQGTMTSSEARLQGSWLVTVTIAGPDAPPPFEALETYTDGGQIIGSQPSSPRWIWTPWHGSWTKTGRREFASTEIAFAYNPATQVVYKVILRNTLVIEPDGDTFNSTSSSQEWFGPDGYHEGPFDSGNMTQGIRIHAE